MLRVFLKIFKFVGPFALSTILHAGAGAGLLYLAPQLINDKDTIIEFSLAEKKPPPPPPKPVPPPPPPPKPKPPPPPKAVEKAKEEIPPPPKPAPNQEPPKEVAKDQPPPKPVFGLNMSSVVSGENGGDTVAFRVGNTLMVEPEKKVTPPEEVKPLAYVAPKKEVIKPVPVHKVSRQPRAVSVPKPPYPPEAKSRGIQGQVILKVFISETGAVSKVEIMKGIDPQLDELAREALLKAKFQPAIFEDKPVPTVITFRYNWELYD